MEVSFGIVIERVALDVTVGDEGGNVFVGPGEDGEDDVDVVLLVAPVDAADNGVVFGVAGGAGGALAAANALYGDVEDFVFLHLLAAEAASAGWHTFACEEVEESDLRLKDFYAVAAAVGEGAWRVDGGVLVDGAVVDAGFFGELEDDVGVLAAAVRDFYGLVAYGGLDETHGVINLTLEDL